MESIFFLLFLSNFDSPIIFFFSFFIQDLEGLRVQSEQGARMGFSGKQVIHPSQVDVVQQAFTPSQEKIEWAMGLIEAFKKHQQTGAVRDIDIQYKRYISNMCVVF